MFFKKVQEKYKVTSYSDRYPHAGSSVDGFDVGKETPNLSSIPATFDDYEILKGVRKIPTDEFSIVNYHNKTDIDRVAHLADLISHHRYIDPLIVAMDKEGLYILEGMHRLAAAQKLKIKHVPALIVLDLASL